MLVTSLLLGLFVLLAGCYGVLYCLGRLRANRALGRAAAIAYLLQGITTGILMAAGTGIIALGFWARRDDKLKWFNLVNVVLGAALVLGGWFLRDAWRVWRQRDTGEWSAPAWRLYKFSLLYLALLFAAMAVDRHL